MNENQYTVPPERAVPKFKLSLSPTNESALNNRLGGLPNAPSTMQVWPEAHGNPMQFILQLVGVAGGGKLDLGGRQSKSASNGQ